MSKNVSTKKEAVLEIPVKKTIIIGLLLSLIFSILYSYSTAKIFIIAGFGRGELTPFDLGSLMVPIIFAVFSVFTILYVLLCSISFGKDEK